MTEIVDKQSVDAAPLGSAIGTGGFPAPLEGEEVIHNLTNAWQTVLYKGPNLTTDADRLLYEDCLILGRLSVGFISSTRNANDSRNAEDLVGLTLRRCRMYGLAVYWMLRLYDVADFLAEDCEVWHIGDIANHHEQDGSKVEGHAFYLNAGEGDLTFRRNHIHNIMGQGLQLVYRDGEGRVGPSGVGDRITVDGCIFQECAQSAERGAQSMAIYNPGHELVEIHNTWSISEGVEYPITGSDGVVDWSRGGLFIGNGQVARQTPRVEITFLRILHASPDRSEATFENIGSLSWKGGFLQRLENPSTGVIDGRAEIRLAADVLTGTIGGSAGTAEFINGNWDLLRDLGSGYVKVSDSNSQPYTW